MLKALRLDSTIGVTVVCGLLVLGLAACTNDDEETTGPVNTEVIVRDIAVTPSLLRVGNAAIVEVLVTDGLGVPLAEQTVRLSATPGSGGSFSGAFFNTNASGIAAATFTAGSAGTVTIRAWAATNPTSEKSTTVTIEENLTVDSTGIAMILTVTPSLLPADDQLTATVEAELTGQDGEPIDDGTVVKFAAGEKFNDVDGDGLWTENVDELVYDADDDGEWDANGTIDQVVYTEDGIATATYRPSNKPGHVHIKVTAGEPGSQISNDISIVLTGTDPVHTIALTPAWQRIQVRGTGGIEWARIVAELYDQHGNLMPEDVPVSFTITSGPGGGEDIDGDPVGPVEILTNSLGQATVTLNAGTLPGTVFLRARSSDVVSEATQVTIRSGPAAFISVGADTCNLPSWGYVGYSNRIIAAVRDIWGNEVADSTAVYFGTEQGLIEGAAETQIVPTVRGKAITYWNSGEPRNDPYVYYWAETAGGTVADTSVFIESGRAASGTFLQYPDSLYADGTSNGRVIIEVLDINGVYKVDGTPITVEAELGDIESGELHDGCYSSTYIGRYTSTTLDRDHSYSIPGDGIGAIDVISATVDGTAGFNGTTEVVLLTGPSYSENCTVLAPTNMRYGSSAAIEVIVRDRWENPLGGHAVAVSTDSEAGSISGSPQYTDAFGLASGFTFTATADRNVETAVITARDTDPNFGGMSVVVVITLQE
jgi:hypothetical protein